MVRLKFEQGVLQKFTVYRANESEQILHPYRNHAHRRNQDF